MAIADIIDNSISAHAKNIYFDAGINPDTGSKYIMVSDDGNGLSEEELVKSLRMGSIDPLKERDRSDLGRFGLGLKTASFSHCRKLTVASKTSVSEVSLRQWDLDYIREKNDWCLKHPDISEYPVISEKMSSMSHGTIVLWENIDRLGKKIIPDENIRDDSKEFGKYIKRVNRHLEMVFHRYLEDEDFTLYLSDGLKAEPWDPFMRDLSTPLPSESHILGIVVRPYILPHRSKLTDKQYDDAKGPLGSWGRAQGFYVYREKRLIMPGTWLGIQGFTKSRDTDLARIELIFSNRDDADWMLDVKKTTVRIPEKYRSDIGRIAKIALEQSRKVRSYRGKVSRREHPGDYKFLWDMDKSRGGEVRYRINRNHPLIENILENPDTVSKEEIITILRMIEETVPVQGIIHQDMLDPDSVPEPFCDVEKEEILKMLDDTVRLMNIDTMSKEQICDILLNMEPFSEYKELVYEYFRVEV